MLSLVNKFCSTLLLFFHIIVLSSLVFVPFSLEVIPSPSNLISLYCQSLSCLDSCWSISDLDENKDFLTLRVIIWSDQYLVQMKTKDCLTKQNPASLVPSQACYSNPPVGQSNASRSDLEIDWGNILNGSFRAVPWALDLHPFGLLAWKSKKQCSTIYSSFDLAIIFKSSYINQFKSQPCLL